MQRHSVTSLDTARSLANGPSWGGGAAEGEVSMRSLGIAASPISLLSMGGVCWRSLTAGKILFTGRQTCSLYLVLWLWGLNTFECRTQKGNQRMIVQKGTISVLYVIGCTYFQICLYAFKKSCSQMKHSYINEFKILSSQIQKSFM